MKFHQILIQKFSLIRVKLWKIHVIKTSIYLCTTLQGKFDSLQHIINKNTDVLLISETKIDSSFLSFQFHLEGYATPYILERNTNGSGILLYASEDIPSALLNSDSLVQEPATEVFTPFLTKGLTT